MKNLVQLFLETKNNKFVKEINWRNWAIKILKRRSTKEIVLQADACAYKGTQIVNSVEEFGGGFKFISKACSGCVLGKIYFGAASRIKFTPCILLSSPLFTRIKVKRGDKINLDTGLIVP